MFFPRLRRQAKWMFVFLALVFGVGFVAFGVGSSLPGTGVVDFFESGDSTGLASVNDARDKVAKNPKNAGAQLELSRALQREGRNEEAIQALVAYTELRPKDAEALQGLALLYTNEANRARDEALIAQAEAQAASGIAAYQDSQELAEVFGAGALDKAVQETASTRLNEASTRSTTALQNATATYQKLVKVEPNDPELWYLMAATAEQTGKNDIAIRGYREFIRLSPDDAQAQDARQRIKQLQSAGSTTVTPGGTTRINR